MNDDEELFDGATPVPPGERGQSFGLSAACYGRMAKCALHVADYANVEPVTIRRLRAGGCQLLLYGTIHAYTLRVDPSTAPARVTLYFLPLDSLLSGPGCELITGYDEPKTWHRLSSTMIWREGRAGSDELLEWSEIDECLREANGWS